MKEKNVEENPMTKLQSLEERIARDTEMCGKINAVLDSLETGDEPVIFRNAAAIGRIMAIMENAGRRKAEEWG